MTKDKNSKQNQRTERFEKWFAEFRQSMQELRDSQLKTDEQLKELRDSQLKTDEQLRKTDEQLKELRDSQLKTDEQLRKTDEQLRKTDEQLNKRFAELGKRIDQLTNGWGMFVEGLVAPAIPKVFAGLNANIPGYSTRVKRQLGSQSIEMDVLAVGTMNGNRPVVIAVSVKSRLQRIDVEEHLRHLEKFFDFYTEYRDRELLGVVAGIRLDEGVVKYAEKNGLYVIGSSGEVVELLNKKGFKPRVWREKRQ